MRDFKLKKTFSANTRNKNSKQQNLAEIHRIQKKIMKNIYNKQTTTKMTWKYEKKIL